MIGDRREFFKQGLNDLYLPVYERLCQLLGPEWKPYSGYRTFDSQDKIFAIGRMQSSDGSWTVVDEGRLETGAAGGDSPHNYGCATDWTYFEQEGDAWRLVWLDRRDPRWEEYGAAVKKAKLRWGGDFHRRDVGHNELHIAIDWPTVHRAFLSGGLGAANAAIYAAILGNDP